MKLSGALLFGAGFLCFSVIAGHVCRAQETKDTFAKTSSTFGWEVLNDKPPVSSLELTDGPQEDNKAILLKYQFEDGVWIALTRSITLSLKAGEGIGFRCKGSGGGASIVLKFFDSNGAASGFTIPGGSLSTTWKEVIAPRSEFKYLYGGNSSMQWNNLVKLEITLDSPQGRNVPSELAVADFKLLGPKELLGKGKETFLAAAMKIQKKSDGSYLINKFEDIAGLNVKCDQDGSLAFSQRPFILNEKTIQAVKFDYNFGAKGVWNAIVLTGNLNLEEMKKISFLFKGTGGENILQFKVIDVNGAAFGYEVNFPTNIKKWARIVIAKEKMQYFYGGNGARKAAWDRIQTIEFVIRKKEGSDSKGSLVLYNLEYR